MQFAPAEGGEGAKELLKQMALGRKQVDVPKALPTKGTAGLRALSQRPIRASIRTDHARRRSSAAFRHGYLLGAFAEWGHKRSFIIATEVTPAGRCGDLEHRCCIFAVPAIDADHGAIVVESFAGQAIATRVLVRR